MIIDEAGDGPALILIHGWAMHSGIFKPLVDLLKEQYKIYLVDLPGHGRSKEMKAGLDSLPALAETIAERTPPAIWLGWSLGGLIGLQAALQRPECVKGLVQIGASPKFAHSTDWTLGADERLLLDMKRDLTLEYRKTLDRFLALECHGSEHARQELRALRAHIFEHGEPNIASLQDGLELLRQTDFRRRLGDINCPALWLAGERDKLIPWQAMHWAAEQMPVAHFAKIKGAGHAPFLSDARQVSKSIRQFADFVLA